MEKNPPQAGVANLSINGAGLNGPQNHAITVFHALQIGRAMFENSPKVPALRHVPEIWRQCPLKCPPGGAKISQVFPRQVGRYEFFCVEWALGNCKSASQGKRTGNSRFPKAMLPSWGFSGSQGNLRGFLSGECGARANG